MYISRNAYASKIKERLTAELGLRFVDQSSPNDPHVKECLINFMHLERTNATVIMRKILEFLFDPSISLDLRNIRGQAYDGASVMSSGKGKIKEISLLALFTHCYAHCSNLSIATSNKLSECEI